MHGIINVVSNNFVNATVTNRSQENNNLVYVHTQNNWKPPHSNEGKGESTATTQQEEHSTIIALYFEQIMKRGRHSTYVIYM
jgi:hypothetical protein